VFRRLAPVLLAGLALAASPLPPGPGSEILYKRCSSCHTLTTTLSARGASAQEWAAIVRKMEGYGMRLTEGERQTLLDYLARHFGPEPQSAPEASAPLDGEALYRRHCATCHEQPDIAPPLLGRPAWREHPDYIAQVVFFGLSGTLRWEDRSYATPMEPLPFLDDAQVAAVVEYLAEQPFTAEAAARERAKGLTPSLVRLLRPLP